MKKYLLPILLIGFWSCEEEQDTTPPTVTITFPQNNSSVSEMVTITCTSSDNEGVDKVELWVNGVTTGLTDNSEPYSFDWNTTLVDNGSYSITVRSYDTSDNTTDSEPIVLTVDNTQSTPQPTNITSVVFENGGFTITWDESMDGDFSSYELEKSTDSTMNSPSVVFTTDSLEQTTYFDTDVNPLIYQYYRVTVIDTFDYETKGQIVSSSLDPVPTSVNVESVEYDTTQMTISWSESSDGDFKQYNLLTSGSESGEKTSVTSISNKSTTSHTITEFNPNIENWYWIEVSDTLGQTSIGTGMTNTLNNIPNPVDVTSVTYDLESMTITWEDYVPNMNRINQMNQNTRSTVTNDFVSYELLQSETENGTYTSVVIITDQSTTSYSLTEYDPTQENWFKVKVTDFWNLTSTGNGMTNEIESPPTPSVLYPITYDEGFQISWSQNDDDDFQSYTLIESDSEDMSNYQEILTTEDQTDTSYSRSIEIGVIKYYQVITKDIWELQSVSNAVGCNPTAEVTLFSATFHEEYDPTVKSFVYISDSLGSVIADTSFYGSGSFVFSKEYTLGTAPEKIGVTTVTYEPEDDEYVLTTNLGVDIGSNFQYYDPYFDSEIIGQSSYSFINIPSSYYKIMVYSKGNYLRLYTDDENDEYYLNHYYDNEDVLLMLFYEDGTAGYLTVEGVQVGSSHVIDLSIFQTAEHSVITNNTGLDPDYLSAYSYNNGESYVRNNRIAGHAPGYGLNRMWNDDGNFIINYPSLEITPNFVVSTYVGSSHEEPGGKSYRQTTTGSLPSSIEKIDADFDVISSNVDNFEISHSGSFDQWLVTLEDTSTNAYWNVYNNSATSTMTLPSIPNSVKEEYTIFTNPSFNYSRVSLYDWTCAESYKEWIELYHSSDGYYLDFCSGFRALTYWPPE